MAQLNKEEKFSFKLDLINKKFNVKGIGTIQPEDADYFVSEYNKCVRTIKASDYELVFNCIELRLAGKDLKSGTDMTVSLKNCLDLYNSTGFKNIVFDCKGNLSMAMQLNRLGKEVGLSSFQVLK